MSKISSPSLTLSTIAIAMILATNAHAADAAKDKASTSKKDAKTAIEKITVYGRHNQLILNSGTATKSNMSLMETPAAVVVVDKLLLQHCKIAYVTSVVYLNQATTMALVIT